MIPLRLSRCLILLSLWLGLACSDPAHGPAVAPDVPAEGLPPARPDVLLVILDTVRADAVRPDTAPHFEAFSAQGVRFTDATAPASWTWPSHASLFTGEPPWVHGAHAVPLEMGVETSKKAVRVSPLRTDLPTLAERFSDAGYRTVSVAANPFLAPVSGLARGFEQAQQHEDDEVVVAAALEAMHGQTAREDDRPLLLFVNLMAAHAPYALTPRAAHLDARLQPDEVVGWAAPYLTEHGAFDFHHGARPGVYSGVQKYLLGELQISEPGMAWLRARYEAQVGDVDASLGRLLEAWDTAHPDGIVAVSSDHGEAFGEHGQVEHGGIVYADQTHVPLALRANGLEPGIQVSTPVQLHDLHPTLLSLAGVDTPAWTLLDAVDGVPRPGDIWAAAWPQTHRSKPVGGRFAQGWRLLRQGDVAALVSTGEAVRFEGSFAQPGGPTARVVPAPEVVELYDLRLDPGMLRDLSAERAAEAEALAERARGEAPMDLSARPGLDLPDATLERLQVLGYAEP